MEILRIISETLELSGEVLIAYAAIRVTYRFRHEHKVDEKVFAEMKREQNYAILGILLLVSGYILEFFILLT